MHKSFTNTQEDEAAILPGTTAPSSMTAASPGSVIPFPFNRYAAAYPVDDASSLDEDVFELGELAVRFIGTFQFPRLLVVRQDQSQGAF